MKTLSLNFKQLLLAATAVLFLCLCQKTEATGNLYQPGNSDSSPLITPPIIPGSSIDFAGNATLNSSLSTATAFTSISGIQGFANPANPVVQNPTGSYAGVPAGTSVAFSAFYFGTGATINTNFTLWSFTVGADTYSFNVSSIGTLFQTSVFLDVGGNGTAIIDGFSAPATWSIVDTSQGSTPVVTFSASFTTTTPVPEPSVFALMTLAVLGLGVCRFAKKAALVRKTQKH